MNFVNQGDHQMAPSSGQSSTRGTSSKRKQPDSDEEVLHEGEPRPEGPLLHEEPNEDDEYDDDDEDTEEDLRAETLRKLENEQLQRAQEPGNTTQYDDIKVTPFNLEEELEEGQFDEAGNFIFKKKGEGDTDEEETDTWAESVDWVAVERREKEQAQMSAAAQDQEMADDSKTTVIKRDKTTCYKQMLRLMKPDEVVKKTIQRLGNAIPKKKPLNKNAAKFKSQEAGMSKDSQGIAEARRKLDLMIELAHQRLEEGDIDIYQRSYEDIEEAIN